MKKKYIIFIAIAIIIIGVWMIFQSHDSEKDFFLEKDQVLQQQENSLKEQVFLVIDYGDGNSQIFNLEFNQGMTAFDLLSTKAEELNIKTGTYDAGIFIESIQEKKNGQDGKYWLYYINGEMPMVSADNIELKPEDKIEFKFEASPF